MKREDDGRRQEIIGQAVKCEVLRAAVNAARETGSNWIRFLERHVFEQIKLRELLSGANVAGLPGYVRTALRGYFCDDE